MADKWKGADRPNYITNENLRYPYSELPFLGEYKLVKIPVHNDLVEHVDYWGEGRLDDPGGYSGFTNCYNVNRQYQLVSNGSDAFCKIPNRIPVIDENDCDTSKYIKNNCVKLVTLMGAPIIESCARDIARIVDPTAGSVILYGFEGISPDIQRITKELSDISMFYCPRYKLPDSLEEITLFDSHIAYLNATDIEAELYNAIDNGQIDTAVLITKSLHKTGGDYIISNIIDKLLEFGMPSTMSFAYKLWESGEKDIIKKYFPDIFELIFNEDEIIIESRYYENTMLKLDSDDDEWHNRLAWGDDSGDTGTMFSWMMVPMWKEDKVIFQIKNYEYNMLLRLDIHDNSAGERKCWGSQNIDEERYNWKLLPKKLQDKVVFFIMNTQYELPLKLDDRRGKNGDRQLWGTNENYIQSPEEFEWVVQSYYQGKQD